VFCSDLTEFPGQDVPEEHRRYRTFMHEAEILMWAFAGAVERRKATADEALETCKPYRSVWALDEAVAAEFDGGFPSTNRLKDQAPIPGIEEFRRAGVAGTPE